MILYVGWRRNRNLKSVKRGLKQISKNEWDRIKKLSRPISDRLVELGWWNNKCYWRKGGTDGCSSQKTWWGRLQEIPYDRDIFKTSKTRFGLGENPVAYLSNDFVVNCCEVIAQLKNKKALPWSTLNDYLSGRTHKKSKKYWYPISVKVKSGALILDLINESVAFLDIVLLLGGWSNRKELLDEVILNRNSNAYPATQEISATAFENGFDAVCYQSVRAPTDVMMPDRNLVVFNRTKVTYEKCDQ